MKKRTAPHIHRNLSAPQIYVHILVALLPCCAAAVFYYGLRAAVLIIWSAVLFYVSDRVISVEIRQDKNYYDLSGIISGIIIALLLPANASLLMASIAVLFASIVVKQFFGGVGSNIFNPALAGRAFIEIVYSDQLRFLPSPVKDRWVVSSLLKGVTEGSEKVLSLLESIDYVEIVVGSYPGFMGVTGAVFALIGGIYLLKKGIIRPYAMLSFFIAYSIFYMLILFDRASSLGLIMSLLSHGVVFIVVFALNDYTTIPSSRIGHVLFGAGSAFLMVLMKSFGDHSGSLFFPVLAMNIVTPVIEFYVRPAVFGRKDDFFDKVKEGVKK